MLYNVTIVPPDAHPITGECQVHLREILMVKQDSLHKLYEIVRSASIDALIVEALSKKQRQQAERASTRKQSQGTVARKQSFPGVSTFLRGDAAVAAEAHKEQTLGHGSAAVVPAEVEHTSTTLFDASTKRAKTQSSYEVHGGDLSRGRRRDVELIYDT